MSDDTEVRIRLVVDDESQATVAKMKEGLAGVGKSTEEAEKKASMLTGAFMKANIELEIAKKAGEILSEGFKSAWEMAEGFAEAALKAAEDAEKQERAMAGVLSMMDQGTHSMAEVLEYSHRVREDLEEAGIKAGVSADQMTRAFDVVVERGAMSSEKAKELTEHMANVGKFTRGGMDGLAQSFSQLESGMIRGRSPLAQLVASTGMLHGNAKSVAAEMTHMIQSGHLDKAVEIASKAIEKQDAILKKGGGMGPMPLDQMKVSFEGLREMTLDNMGRPMLDKLLPPINELRMWLINHSEELIEYASKVGEKMGEFIEVGADIIKSVLGALKDEWPVIQDTFSKIAAPLRETWDKIYAQKDEIAAGIGGVIKGFVELVHETVDVTEKLLDKLHKFFENTGALADALTGGATAALRKGAFQSDQEHAESGIRKGMLDPNVTSEAFAKFEEDYRKASIALGENNSTIDEYLRALDAFRNRTMGSAREFDEAADKDDIGKFLHLYKEAEEKHDKATMQYAANLAANSDKLAFSLLDSKELTGNALEEFAKMIGEKNKKWGDLFKGKAEGEKIQDIAAKGGTNMVFHNAQFHIKQDFRNEDPDRIALIMRKDLLSHSAARVQSRLSTPFGL